MIDGREKGQSYMREVCRKLERWAGCRFVPRPTVVAPLDGWAVKGDVAHDASVDFPFVVEIKKIEGWELDGAFESPKWPVWKWWEQCLSQAASRESAHPLLIFSRNRRKSYVLTRWHTVEWLKPKPEYGPIVTLRTTADSTLGILLLDDLVGTSIPRRRRS